MAAVETMEEGGAEGEGNEQHSPAHFPFLFGNRAKMIISVALAIGLGFLGLVSVKEVSLNSQGLGFLNVHYQHVSLEVLFQTRGWIHPCALAAVAKIPCLLSGIHSWAALSFVLSKFCCSAQTPLST